MNYFAHAFALLEDEAPDPYLLAGVAVPDWLGVAARRVKCRSRHAAAFADDPDPRVRALAAGVQRHHADDAWFHATRAFSELSLGFARDVRDACGEREGMRPWFLGHILVELLLDASLIEGDAVGADRYYRAVDAMDAGFIAATVGRMTGKPLERLAEFIGRYAESRFLLDYADDDRLCHRVGQVLTRVGLPPLPPGFRALLPGMRGAVAASVPALLEGPSAVP